MRCRTALCIALFAALAHPAGRAATATTTQTLTASIVALAKLSAPGTLLLSPTGTSFSPFAASMNLNYRARTTPTGGGTITVQATGDFSPIGGPSVASGDLTYVCTGASLGAGCASSQTVSSGSATTVLSLPANACTGGGGACSGSNPNTVSLQFNLNNNPAASTGTYQVTLQFTASAI